MTADGRTARLLDRLHRHEAADAREERSLRQIRALVDWLPQPFDEQADATHVTTSGIVFDLDGARILLHRHKRLGIWLQPGGHIDPGEEPEQAVLREVAEETGLSARHPASGSALVHVDVHEGGPGHLHLDLRYLLRASGDVALSPEPGESREVEWVHADEVAARSDASTSAAVAAATRSL